MYPVVLGKSLRMEATVQSELVSHFGICLPTKGQINQIIALSGFCWTELMSQLWLAQRKPPPLLSTLFPPVPKLLPSALAEPEVKKPWGGQRGEMHRVAFHYPVCPADSAGLHSSVPGGPEKFQPGWLACQALLCLYLRQRVFFSTGTSHPSMGLCTEDDEWINIQQTHGSQRRVDQDLVGQPEASFFSNKRG